MALISLKYLDIIVLLFEPNIVLECFALEKQATVPLKSTSYTMRLVSGLGYIFVGFILVFTQCKLFISFISLSVLLK